MGTGNKLDPTKLEVTDIYKTSICPLARVMRRELKKRKIPALKVVYSTEKPIETDAPVDPETHKKTPGSISFDHCKCCCKRLTTYKVERR